MHLMLISLHRLHSDDLLRALGTKSLELVAGSPWQTVLMKLTLGQATLPEALAIATTDHERVQAYFYFGTRRLSDGHISDGYDALDACLKYNVGCHESWLAEVQKDWALETVDDLDPAEQVANHLAEAQDLLEGLQLDDAMVESEKALTVVQSRLQVNHPQYLAALNMLAAVLLKSDRTSDAEEVLDAALEAMEGRTDIDPTMVATILANRAWIFHTQHRDSEAVPLLLEAIRLREQTHGDSHVSVASASFQLACVFGDLFRFADAETHLVRAAQIYRNISPRGSREAAVTLEHLVTAYVHQSSFDMAATASQELVSECENIGDPELLGYACYRRATVLEESGDHGGAQAFYQRAVSQLRHAGLSQHPTVARSLLRAATCCGAINDSENALRLYEEALPLFEKLIGCENTDYVNGLMHYALTCTTIRGAKEALPALRRLSQLVELLHPPDHPETAVTLELLAQSYLTVADIGSAVSALTEAARILRKCSDHRRDRLPIVLRNLANALARVASPREALSVLEELRELQPETSDSNPSELSDTYNSLSGVYFQLGYSEKAKEAAKRCYDLRLNALGPGHTSTATAQLNLATLILTSGDALTALSILQDLLAKVSDLRARDERLFASVLTTIGGCYADLGRVEDAERALRNAVETEPGAGGLDALSLAHKSFELIALFLRRRQLAPCLQWIERAGTLLTQVFVENLLVGDEQRDYLLARLRALMSLALHMASQHAELCTAGPASAWQLWSRWRTMASDLAAVKKSVVDQSPEAMKLTDELRPLRQELAGIKFRGPESSVALDAYRTTVNDLERRILERERRVLYHLGVTWREKYAEAFAMNPEDVVPFGTAVIDFVRYEAPSLDDWPHSGQVPLAPVYCAFVLTGQQRFAEVRLIDCGPCARIDRLIRSVRADMSPLPHEIYATNEVESSEECTADAGGIDSDGVESDDLETLSALILGPLAEALQGCDKLLVIPDGEIWTLPLEILRLNAGQCVLDRWDVSYLTNPREAIHVAGTGPASEPREAVVVAGPDFDLMAPESPVGPREGALGMTSVAGGLSEGSKLDWEQLPGCAREGVEVAKVLGVEPWIGQDALDGRVKNVQGPLVLHIATHGFFVGGNLFRLGQQIGMKTFVSARDMKGGLITRLASQPPTIRSCIVLSGANTWLHGGEMAPDAEDGFLNAEEVSLMNLQGTELVFLSACETGLGEARMGDGVLGLAQAFCQAGAKTCIVNLWKVSDDETTVNLVTEFYTRLMRGESRSAALRSAKQFSRRYGAKPRDWGGFVCLGAHGVIAGLSRSHAEQRGAER
jgi:CHAT domain-containing protein/tetratricopeptide (TPR) repeat protein